MSNQNNAGPPPHYYTGQTAPGAGYPRAPSNQPPATYQMNQPGPAYPGQSVYPGHYGAPQHPPLHQQPRPLVPAPPAQFDAGARFDHGARMQVPPPPPGVMPNQAQYTAAQGGTVNVTQAPQHVWSASSDGGMSTHFD